jgi:hypothetical protein
LAVSSIQQYWEIKYFESTAQSNLSSRSVTGAFASVENLASTG